MNREPLRKNPVATPVHAPAHTQSERATLRQVVDLGLRSPGGEIDATMRATMEKALGTSFAHVRVHTGREAGESALALGAEAYSVGNELVFAPGRYHPQSAPGRRLLAHELTHVAQRGGEQAKSAMTLQIDSPHSEREQQAARSAEHVVQGRSVSEPMHRAARGTVSRSLLGAGIGGLLGGAFGTALGIGIGALFGPVGMAIGGVIGGIGGLIGGAIVGDMLSHNSRGLTSREKRYARDIFHNAVDYDAVRITRGSALSVGAARTTGNTINLQEEHFVGDTMELSDAGLLVLVHEMGHVWQYQNGGLAYIPSSLIPQIIAAVSGESRNAAYDWRAAVRNNLPWHEWNAEQQAECISDYNESLRRTRGPNPTLADYETVTLAQPYIDLVRQRIGAPGSTRRTQSAGATDTSPTS